MPPQVERDGHHHEGVKADDAKPHPERAVTVHEGDQQLNDVERQELVKQQDDDVQQDKSQPEQGEVLVKVIAEGAFHQGLYDLAGDGKSPRHREPDQKVTCETRGTRHVPP